jgi:hypothetical protein
MTTPLRLRAKDVDDLAVLSAMIQDALAPLSDMVFAQEQRRFVIALNRFRWNEPNPPTRTHALLSVEGVARVRMRGIDRSDRDRIMNVLSLTFVDGAAEFTVSGGGAIRLEVESLDCFLEDVGEPWPAQRKPEHE